MAVLFLWGAGTAARNAIFEIPFGKGNALQSLKSCPISVSRFWAGGAMQAIQYQAQLAVRPEGDGAFFSYAVHDAQ